MSTGEEVHIMECWNTFGIQKPRPGKGLPITVEINPPLEGINPYLAGVYLEDDLGHVIMAHRGRIGGGKPGVGKSLFVDNYRGRWLAFREGNLEKRASFVGALDSLDFGPQLRDFVLEVARIKRLASPAQIPPECPIGPQVAADESPFASFPLWPGTPMPGVRSRRMQSARSPQDTQMPLFRVGRTAIYIFGLKCYYKAPCFQ
jgi:hypothetical protein